MVGAIANRKKNVKEVESVGANDEIKEKMMEAKQQMLNRLTINFDGKG